MRLHNLTCLDFFKAFQNLVYSVIVNVYISALANNSRKIGVTR